MPTTFYRKDVALSWVVAALVVIGSARGLAKETSLQNPKTTYASIRLDDRGFITSIKALATGRDYCPEGHPSPLLSLHENGTPNKTLLTPEHATFDDAKGEARLTYANGSVATVRIGNNADYFRFQLVALEPRGKVDNVVWGPIDTTVSKIIGDIIGVVRGDDWAIGLYGLDDNTIPGPVEDGDCYSMGYYIHSENPDTEPLPDKYKEGKWFNIGGNGKSDVAFYSHPEPYFHQFFGSGAKLRPEFGSTIAYHSRDRNRSYVHYFALLPGFQEYRRRHMVSDPVPGVGFIGSAVALYACPDDRAVKTLETITRNEGLPFVTFDGKWVRDPSIRRPTVYWNGPVDKAIEYTKALGLKDISHDTGNWFPSLDKHWVGTVTYKGKRITYIEFSDMCHKEGLTHGGLHTLCIFLQGGISRDVTPVPSEHLQTICRTTLAQDISATDTEIVVTDPSFLAEKGTWPRGDDSNYLRIGGEMLRYAGISDSAPWTLKGVKRGHASKALPHKAGDELVKLQQNCYNGFVPDMELMLKYAEYYARLMVDNGMDTINFDGYESLMYQNHGYYAMKTFNRRLFTRYHELTGKWPRVTGSNVFAGAWEYMIVCDVGGGNNMFNAVSGKRAIEGKDIGDGYNASYFPGTWGIQGWHSDWSLYDGENIQAKAVGWDYTFAFSIGQAAIERSGEKDGILKAFAAWQEARERGVFPEALKRKLRDSDLKFHLEKAGPNSYTVYTVKETRVNGKAGATAGTVTVDNPYGRQPLPFSLQIRGAVKHGAVIKLPDGNRLKTDKAIAKNQFIICKGDKAYLANCNRKKIADLPLSKAVKLPKGKSVFSIQFPNGQNIGFTLSAWALDDGTKLTVTE